MTTEAKRARRQALSKKAWSEAFKRLFAEAGQDWPLGSDLSSRELVQAEHEANRTTAAYVERGESGAREALEHWEKLMMAAIKKTKDKRGCGECGHEKVAEVVMDDGSRRCGRCRSGQ
jgi:hypothetical protein